ncbi:MAG: hypothetical protein KAR12_14755 [Methylococcales bacterium]|nr:hypothetical protein [Methylococcales bacterium]
MKISKLTNGLLVSLLLSASVVEAESKYPATDFQPKVVFQDSDYKHSSSAPSSSGASVGEVSVADPDYPAANFQPEVLYKDDSYKHAKGNVSRSSSNVSSSSAGGTAVEQTESAEDSSMSLILGLGILAVAGFVFYSKNAIKAPAKRKPAARRPAAAVVSASEGAVSGVDKYLESKVGVQPSGVSKYLDERNTSVSGVSKYVAKQKVSARLASVTGVEKYLKDRG